MGLAYWLMDVGNKTGSGFHFNTNAFSNEDVNRLVAVLKEKFEFKCSVHSRNRIYIMANSVPKLIETVKPYIENSMKYKLEF